MDQPDHMINGPAVQNRALSAADAASVRALNAAVFGPGRFARTAYRVRESAPTFSSFCSGAFLGETLIASLRLTSVKIGDSGPHLLLGPLAVAGEYAGLGYGKSLVGDALVKAKAADIGIITLVGDLPYYDRFGFKPARPGSIVFPGPVDPARILVCELTPGTLASAVGAIVATPKQDQEP